MKLLTWASRKSSIPHVGNYGSDYQFPIIAFKDMDHHGARHEQWLNCLSQAPRRLIKPASKTSAEEIFGPLPDRDITLFRLVNFLDGLRSYRRLRFP